MPYNIEWLINKFDNGVELRFIFFWGHTNSHKDQKETVGRFIFSQWFQSPFVVDGIVYPTTEHWMMAWKASMFADKTTFDKIIRSSKPGEAKELGRQVRNFDEIVWDKRKFDVVKIGTIHKFNQNPELLKYLLATGDQILCEASPVDSIWGIGLSHDSKMIEDPYTWNGKNLLGFALMEVRDFFNAFGRFDYMDSKLLPPWKVYPAIDPLDMHWRMGAGEQYVLEFGEAFERLNEREKTIYELSYPAMGDWAGYYDGAWWNK